jgi:hypothetical protein
VRSAEEYAQLDAEDESLARWKASLGIGPGTSSDNASGPKVLSRNHLLIHVLNFLRSLVTGHGVLP